MRAIKRFFFIVFFTIQTLLLQGCTPEEVIKAALIFFFLAAPSLSNNDSPTIEGYSSTVPAASCVATVNGSSFFFELIEGKIVVEGDMILGNFADLQADPSTSNVDCGTPLTSNVEYSIESPSTSYPQGNIAIQDWCLIILWWPRCDSQHWADANNKALVPYQIIGDWGDKQKDVTNDILTAMAHWEDAVGTITFKERDNETDYVAFVARTETNTCASKVGRQGGKQDVELSSNCRLGTIIHEIGHVLGLQHEQNRSDRNKFVRINLDQITLWAEDRCKDSSEFNECLELKQAQYAKSKRSFDFGPYDYGSIMHYPPLLDGFRLMDVLKPHAIWAAQLPCDTKRIGQRKCLSDGDIKAARKLYPGSRSSPQSPLDWPMLGNNLQRTHSTSSVVTMPLAERSRFTFPEAVHYRSYDGSDTVISDGTHVYIATGGACSSWRIRAINIETGIQAWQHQVRNSCDLSLVYDAFSDRIIIGQRFSAQRVTVLEADDGAFVWEKSIPNGAFVKSVLVVNGTIFVSIGESGSSPPSLVALRLTDGSERWSNTLTGGRITAPSYANGSVFVATSLSNISGPSTLYSFNAENGDENWSTSISVAGLQAPTIHQGKVMVVNRATTGSGPTPTVFCVDETTGDSTLRFNPQNFVNTSIAAFNGAAYVGITCDNSRFPCGASFQSKIYSIDVNTCTQNWVTTLTDFTVGRSALVVGGDGTLFVEGREITTSPLLQRGQFAMIQSNSGVELHPRYSSGTPNTLFKGTMIVNGSLFTMEVNVSNVFLGLGMIQIE